MAESGQTDDNVILQGLGASPQIDRRPEWRAERARMIKFIVDERMKVMSKEEAYSRARSSIVESLFYEPDYKLITHYEEYEGTWSEIMNDRYRAPN